MRKNLMVRGLVATFVAGTCAAVQAAPYTDWGQPYSGANIPPSMVLLHMDETSGTTATNSGDTVAWGTTDGVYSSDASGNVASGAGNPASGFGRAFDSNSSRTLNVPSAPSLVGSFINGYVIEMWFKADTLATSQVLTAKYTGSLGSPGGRHFYLSIDNGKLYFNPWRSDGVFAELVGTTTINAGEWHHVAAQYHSGNDQWELFLDGNLEDTSAASAWGFTTAANPIWIGSYEGGSSFFDGQIDEFRISSGQYDFAPVPEPAALSLIALAGLLAARRK